MFGRTITAYEPEHLAMLRSSAKSFVAGASSFPEIRKLRADASFSKPRFRQIAEMGWLGLAFNAELELGFAEMVALHRELGRGLLPEPVIASGVLAAGILAGGDGGQAKAHLASLFSGERMATLAWQGAAGAMSSADVKVSARREASGWVLDGAARFVPWAEWADGILVAARAEDGLLVAWVDRKASGLSVQNANALDRTSFCDILLQQVKIEGEAVMASPAIGAALLDRVLDISRVAVSAELVGMSEELFRITLDYLKQRKQFGKPIGSYQALQFTAVDLFVQIEMANSVVAAAARKLDADIPPAQRADAVAACKIRCSDAAIFMAKQGIQMHGAIGYTDECDVSLFVKRAFQWAAWLGNGPAHRRRLQSGLEMRAVA